MNKWITVSMLSKSASTSRNLICVLTFLTSIFKSINRHAWWPSRRSGVNISLEFSTTMSTTRPGSVFWKYQLAQHYLANGRWCICTFLYVHTPSPGGVSPWLACRSTYKHLSWRTTRTAISGSCALTRSVWVKPERLEYLLKCAV